jgi:hypothetical protein
MCLHGYGYKFFFYAHHYVVDEFDMNKLPGDRNLAAKLLAGEPLSKDTATLLQENLMIIKPDISPWLNDTLVNYHLNGLPTTMTFGFTLDKHAGYGHLRVYTLIQGSFVYDGLRDKHVEGLLFPTINGIVIWSLTDFTCILNDIHIDQMPLSTMLVLVSRFFLANSIEMKITLITYLPNNATMPSAVPFSVCALRLLPTNTQP